MTDWLTILNGDCVQEMRKLPDASVQCCVTSPPYFGLRDYGVAGQIGLEASPAEYVEKMVVVFREVKRVLREDGTLWLNLGDSYGANSNGSPQSGMKALSDRCSPRKNPRAHHAYQDESHARPRKLPPFFKLKDLMGIPWRVAFALQAEGWYLRCDIIWSKPNPMPESVTDRPTKAHEYIFLLTKSPRYFYDHEAIKEGVSESTHARVSQNLAEQVGSFRANGGNKTNGPMKAVIAGSSRKIAQAGQGKRNASYEQAMCLPVSTRNKRSVWSVGTAPYSEAHFATFPPELIKPCILAGTSAAGCCAACGAPLVRILESGFAAHDGESETKYEVGSTANRLAAMRQAARARGEEYSSAKKTTGWKPTCECAAAVMPCVVLDPFGGSGTTGMVALQHGRRAILIELNPEYVRLAEKRCRVQLGLGIA